MLLGRTDFNSRLVGKVVHIKNVEEDDYGVVIPGRSDYSYNCVFASRVNRISTNYMEFIEGVYDWCDVNISLLNKYQKEYISLVKRLLGIINERWLMNLEINEYAVLFGSHVIYFRHILDLKNLSCKCLCIPIKPYGLLSVMIINGCVLVQIFNGVETIENEELYMMNMVRFKNAIKASKAYRFAALNYKDDYRLECFIKDLFKYTETNEVLTKLVGNLSIKDLITEIDYEITPYAMLSSNNSIIHIKSIKEGSREKLGKISSSVSLNKWYKSGNGLYYAMIGNRFVYLTIESVYSCSGVVLYKELVSHIENNSRGAVGEFSGTGNVFDFVIGRFRGSAKRKKLLSRCFKTDMAVSKRFCKDSMSCEICDSLGVLQVLDGANQVDVYFLEEEYFGKNAYNYIHHIVFLKDEKYSFYIVDGYECSLEDIKRLRNILLKADSDIFTVNSFKFVIYSYDVESKDIVLDGDKNIIDTCYNFDDCFKICKNRAGKEFLIVRFENGTISGQWRVSSSMTGICSLSKIA